MSETLDTAFQKVSEEYDFLEAVNHLYTRAVENGALLASTRFSNAILADQNSVNYLQGLRQAAAQIEDLGNVAVKISGENVVTVRPDIQNTVYGDGSLTTSITLDQSSLSDSTQLNDTRGAFGDVFVKTDQDGFGNTKVTPYIVVSSAEHTVNTVRGEGGIPLMAYDVRTFATAPLDGSAEIVVPRFETLTRYRRALGILAEKGEQYPWFTDTAARLIGDLENNQVDTAGRHIRQLGTVLDRLNNRDTYQLGVEVLSGILCGNDVIVYGDILENSDHKHLVVEGSVVDVESNLALDETSIIVEAYNNGEPSIHLFPMKSVISVQHID